MNERAVTYKDERVISVGMSPVGLMSEEEKKLHGTIAPGQTTVHSVETIDSSGEKHMHAVDQETFGKIQDRLKSLNQ